MNLRGPNFGIWGLEEFTYPRKMEGEFSPFYFTEVSGINGGFGFKKGRFLDRLWDLTKMAQKWSILAKKGSERLSGYG